MGAIGSAVLHFLWQGALLGLLAAAALGCLPRRAAARRHAVAFTALALGLVSFLVTLAVVSSGLSFTGDAGAPYGLLADGPEGRAAHSPVPGIVAWAWALGVLGMAARLALQGRGARRLRTTAVSAAEPRWQQAFERLRQELGVARGVQLLRSGLAEVPMVVGWLSPVVLVPAAAFTGLSPDQLRALLAHELAHVRRYDHLLNAIQSVVETVLFFHPAVWWISKQVRLEREYCCDDSSVRLTGDPRVLARALATMEALRPDPPTPRHVLAANGGPLMQRIARILGARPDARPSLVGWQLPAGLALAAVLALTGSATATPRPDGEPAARQDERVQKDRQVERVHAEQELARARQRDAQRKEYEKAAQRLKEELTAAVKAGEMTPEQARARFDAWRKERSVVKRAPQRSDVPDPKQVWAKLQAEVEAGRLTKQQAEEKFAAFKKRIAQRTDAAPSDLRLEARKVRAELDAQVKAGKLTREQADARFDAYREKLAARAAEARAKEDPETVIRRIAAAVESGRITPEEGKARIEAYRQQLAARKAAAEEDAARQKELQAAFDRIKQGVEAGKITPAEAERMLQDLERELAASKQKVKDRK